MMILLIAIYTFQCFAVFNYEDDKEKRKIYRNQILIIYFIHFMAFTGMYFKTSDNTILLYYLLQAVLLSIIIFLYTKLYPKVSRLIINNMCMLLGIGFIILTRLSYQKALKQSIIVAGGFIISLFIPVIIRKVKNFSEFRALYGIIGIISLAAVVIAGQVSGGAKLGFTIAGIGIQPSEFVKIIFVFFVAASFYKNTGFKNVCITTIVAAFHVLILVVSKDLGAALIIYVVYLVMLYVSTQKIFYAFAGLGAGTGAAVIAYHLFQHVRIRVEVWKNPFEVYNEGGYQVAQSLFAIGTGSWFGTGLFQGKADAIPVADEDFIFSAIAEEMGLVFALCIILICVSCYVMFLNIAMQLRNRFYKFVALGLGTSYIFQTFLNIGGVTKFIPSTGVTLPLISYGGSSAFSTLIMFAIIQGLYILKEDEDEYIERKRQEKQAQKNAEYRVGYHIVEPGRTGRNGKRRKTAVETKKEKRLKSRTD